MAATTSPSKLVQKMELSSSGMTGRRPKPPGSTFDAMITSLACCAAEAWRWRLPRGLLQWICIDDHRMEHGFFGSLGGMSDLSQQEHRDKARARVRCRFGALLPV